MNGENLLERAEADSFKEPSEMLSILFADDDPEDREHYRCILEKDSDLQYSIREAENSSQVEEMLDSSIPDCLLLDYRFPPGDGLELLERLKKAKGRAFPIVMITGQGSEEIAVKAMKMGAHDYLVKDHLTAAQLDRAIKNAIYIHRLQETVKEQKQAMIENERNRVMLESVGAACHHLSQPLMTLLACLDFLKESESISEDTDLRNIKLSLASVEKMSKIINKLQVLREYRTIPYIEGMEIIDIES